MKAQVTGCASGSGTAAPVSTLSDLGASGWTVRVPAWRNLASTLDDARTDKYERTLARNSRRVNSCANNFRTSASGAPVRWDNKLTACSLPSASLLGSRGENIRNPSMRSAPAPRLSSAALGLRARTYPLYTKRRIPIALSCLSWRAECPEVFLKAPGAPI